MLLWQWWPLKREFRVPEAMAWQMLQTCASSCTWVSILSLGRPLFYTGSAGEGLSMALKPTTVRTCLAGVIHVMVYVGW